MKIKAPLFLAICLCTSSVQPSQDNDDFGQDFYDHFAEMDRQDRFYEKLDEGFDSWEERCLKIGGQEALDNWLKAQENLVYCVTQNFDFQDIQREMGAKKKTGDLDLVFKKYCGEPIDKTRPCIAEFLEVSSHCLKAKDRGGLNITLKMVDAAIDFICHESGERIAMFMAENGMDCLETHQENIVQCINSSVPEVFETSNHKNINLIVFNSHNCRKGDAIRACVEKELLECPDPTPANIVESLMLSMRRATPCNRISKYSSLSGTSDSPKISLIVVTLTLLLFFFFLAAAGGS